jgi:tetratricopeptide (TPR) repeat protein
LGGPTLGVLLAAAVGCGGPLPPPDPYHLAGAKESLSQGNHWFARGCYAEAENYYAESLDSARLSDHVLLMLRAQNSLGAAALARGDADAAAARLERALDLSRSQPGEPELEKILANLGSVAFKLGRLDDAANLWSAALDTAQSRHQNPAPYLCDLARLRLAQNRQPEFLELTALALSAANAGSVAGTEAASVPGVTRLSSTRKAAQTARQAAESTPSVAAQAAPPESDRKKSVAALSAPVTSGPAPLSEAVRADALNLAGQAAQIEGRLDEAEAYFHQALELDRRTENTTGLAQDTESLGLLMLRLSRYREAAGFLDRAFFLRLAAADDQKAEQTLAALTQLSKEQGFPQNLAPYREALRRPGSYRLTRQCP